MNGQEKKMIQKYFLEISTNSGKYCFGIKDTFAALETGAVETLIVFENLDIKHYTLRNTQTGAELTKILTPKEEQDPATFIDEDSGTNLELVEKVPLVEWVNRFNSLRRIISNMVVPWNLLLIKVRKGLNLLKVLVGLVVF